MHQYGSAGVIVKFLETADVVDMRMSADDRFHLQLVATEEFHDAVDFVAGIEHQRLAGYRIADDRAVALQKAHWNGKMKNTWRRLDGSGFRHTLNYNIQPQIEKR